MHPDHLNITLLLGITLPKANDTKKRAKAAQTIVIAKLRKNASTISASDTLSSPLILANMTENVGAIVISNEKTTAKDAALYHKFGSLLLNAIYIPKATPTIMHMIENLSKTL